MFSEESVTAYMTIEHDFQGNRLVGSSLIPVYWNLSFNVVGVEADGLTSEENQIAITIAYQRLNFWLDAILDTAIVANRNSSISDSLFMCGLDNVIMHVPGEPTDDLLCQLLHAKMSVLGGKHLLVGKLALKGTDTKSSYMFYPVEPDDYTLPKLADYLDGDSVYEAPWWHRNDMDVHDLVVPDDTTREEIIGELSTAHIIEAFNEEILSTMFPDAEGPEPTEPTEDGSSWTPTVVK